MIKILRASAGSGKTYNLAKTYIQLLLSESDPSAYRPILAVTFTNKATDEMKRRILKELFMQNALCIWDHGAELIKSEWLTIFADAHMIL